MKKLIIISALFFAACSNNNPVDSGGQQTTETLLIDRTGITDSIHTSNNLVIFNQYFEFPYSEMRVTFEIKGNSVNTQNWFYLRKRTETPFYVFFRDALTSDYIPQDTTFTIASFADTVNAVLNCNVSPSWLCIRDLKIYGK